jgi:ribonuclease E
MADDQATTPDAADAGDKKPARRRRTTKSAAAAPADAAATSAQPTASAAPATDQAPPDAAADAPAAPARRRRRTTAKETAEDARDGAEAGAQPPAGPVAAATVIFQAPEPVAAPSAGPRADDEPAAASPPRRRRRPANAPGEEGAESTAPQTATVDAPAPEPAATGRDSDGETSEGQEPGEGTGASRRRRRGRRGGGRSKAAAEAAGEGEGDEATPAAATAGADAAAGEAAADADEAETGEGDGTGTRHRRRRRRGRGSGSGEGGADGETAAETRTRDVDPDDEIRGIKGSTRMEAKRQRRREGRESSRRRPPVLSEAEFLARRESVERVMVVRQGKDRTQIAVLEDGVLVEHYITRSEHTSYVGNVYLGRVQNVLPSMEAAFVDIGKGRNGVLYAGEVNYDASQLDGRPPRIEQALKSGQSVLVQVTKDPIAHKGARLTSQISIPGRYVVLVPEGHSTGISRKLPDKERTRLKNILKRLTPEDAGLIVRTAAEGASEEQLERDVARLQAQWEDIQRKSQTASAPSLVYGEPDLVVRVIRDIFNEDFSSLVVQGDDEWDMVEPYIAHVAPDLRERVSRWVEPGDAFAHYRIDEQLAKALDRKVWLPSGGSLVIDRTEAMTVVDVNTGKFTGSGGNLEETVTRNNLEAAEEIVRQLRLRDVGGIIVIDFIDMVLESNRELVLRRLVECLGRDRTKHQVAEVTSLGLVQMTRKRIGQGLLDAFSQTCPECNGRGVKVVVDPFEPAPTHAHASTAHAAPAGDEGEPAEAHPEPASA